MAAVQGGPLGDKIGRALWEAVSITADGIIWFGVLPVWLLLKGGGNSEVLLSSEATLFAAGLLCDLVAIVGLKMSFKRARPPHREIGLPKPPPSPIPSPFYSLSQGER